MTPPFFDHCPLTVPDNISFYSFYLSPGSLSSTRAEVLLVHRDRRNKESKVSIPLTPLGDTVTIIQCLTLELRRSGLRSRSQGKLIYFIWTILESEENRMKECWSPQSNSTRTVLVSLPGRNILSVLGCTRTLVAVLKKCPKQHPQPLHP